jgi:hypothetical protein
MALDKIVAGDTLYFEDTVPDYPPSDGWTLKYCLTPLFSTPVQTPITLTATASGETYLIQAAPAVSVTWKPGTYSWDRWVEKSGARPTGNNKAPLAAFLELLPDPAQRTQGYDPRSAARKALDAINAGLETYGTNAHVQAYTIGNRSMTFADTAALLVKRDQLKAEVWREEETARVTAGMPSRRNLRIRMARV